MAHVTLSDRDGVTLLAVDRPPANALDLALLDELVGALDRLAAEPPKALVITGRPGFFSAGLDLKAIPGYGPEEGRRLVEGVNAMVLSAYGLPCPVVCALTGHAIAGGFVLALCGDHRIASSEGRYGLTEIKVGVPFPQAAIGVVSAELAPSAARALALRGALVDAQECVRLGAFDDVAAPDAVLDRALTLARELSEANAAAYAQTKAQLRGGALERMRAAAATDPMLQPR
jgi:enoyl-CoA hydratase